MPSGDDDKTQLATGEEEYPCLEVIAGPRGAGRYPLRSGKNQIGRLSENDIVLDDSSVSRRHAVIDLRSDGAFLIDQGSRNGSRVGRQKVTPDQPLPLAHDTRIQIGAYQLRYLTQAAAPAIAVEEPPPDTQIGTSQESPSEAAPESVPEGEPPPSRPSGRRRWLRLAVSLVVLILLVVAGIVVYHFLKSKPQVVAPPVEQLGQVGEVIPPTETQEPESTIHPVFLDLSTSSPVPAQVYFGTEMIGQTPFRVSTNLEDGKWYEVRAVFQLPEVGETLEEKAQFHVPVGVGMIPIAIDAKIGTFKIGALPRDSQLYLEAYFDKDPARAKPVKFAEIIFGKPIYLPFGRTVIELRRSRQLEGSQTYVDEVIYRREFYFKEGQTSYSLEVRDEDLLTFPIQISSIPSGAKVLIDDREVGVTPFNGTFPTGKHLLVLRKEGFFDYSQVVQMAINTPFVTEIPLKTTEAGEIINRATEFIRSNRHGEALPLLADGFNKNPTPRETAEISYLIGICYLKQQAYADATNYFNKAMAHPDFKDHGRLGLANLTYQQGDPIKALQMLVEVMAASQDKKLQSDAAILFQQISPLKSVLYVTSDPIGAVVFINGTPLAQATPLILHDLGVGTYRIEIKKEGFSPSEVKMNLGVSEFRPVLVKLQPLQ